MAMVDSGFRVEEGECNFRVDYGGMIDDAMPRAPGLGVLALREQPDPSSVHVTAQIHNFGETPLDTAVDGAMLHVVLYEGHIALQTGREVHGSERVTFDEPLAPGETRRFKFEFNRLRGVNASQLAAVVFVDYMPDPTTGRYEMLQGAIAKTDPLPDLPTAVPTAAPTATPTATLEPTIEPTALPTTEPHPTVAAPSAPGLFVPLASKP
ncbi:MAG: hypothetical protein ACK2T6_00885 [Anaerolineae bacterium]